MSNAQHDPVRRTNPGKHIVTAAHSGLSWHRSTHSGGTNNCVEAAGSPTGVHVRDSKNLPAAMRSVAAAAWCIFLGEMRTGASGG